MKLAIIVVGAYKNLQRLHPFFASYKLTKIDQDLSYERIVIHTEIGDHKLLQYASTLKLYGYDIKSIIIQDSNDIASYESILTQFEHYNIENVIVDINLLDNVGFIKTIIQKITNQDSSNIRVNQKRDNNDLSKQRHGREVHVGHLIGQYQQSPPMLFSRDGHSMWMGDMYRGGSAFLILGGPSFNVVDRSRLNNPGILTMGVNNSVKTFRPNLWTSVDHPSHFIKSIWFDPTITKFVPYSHSEKFIFDNEKWVDTDVKVGDCPNVWFFKRNEKFIAEQFLIEDTINWGNHKDFGGGRSVMLAAIRILFHIGVRTIYLLGCDFKMDNNGSKYHFDQNRSDSSIKGNMSTYKLLCERFELLRPIFEKYGLYVYNCNEESGLKAFPIIKFEDAIRSAASNMPIDITNERTDGLYDRLSNIKKKNKNAPK